MKVSSAIFSYINVCLVSSKVKDIFLIKLFFILQPITYMFFYDLWSESINMIC